MTSKPSPPAASGFDTLPLNLAMLTNLAQLGYLHMTPTQAASLPLALLGQDIIDMSAETAAALTLNTPGAPR